MKRETTTNWALMNQANYSNLGVIKSLLRHLDDLLNCAGRGDTVAHAIFLDLMDAADHVSTPIQGAYLRLWLDGYSQNEIAERYQVSQPAVAIKIHRITKKISEYLIS
jgi:DNA-directed RNA polymerase specialized sigma24 family protein